MPTSGTSRPIRALVRPLLRGGCIVLLWCSAASEAAGWRVAGAEFNPVRSMPRATSPADDRDQGVRWLSLSGTLRVADDPGRDEIAIPVAWSARRGVGTVDLVTFELDLQYRHFPFGSNHGGAYAGPLLRVAHRRGYERGGPMAASTERIGVGLVVGYRLPMKSGHYWDLSFSHGRFVGVDPRRDARNPASAVVAIDDVFTDRAVLRLVRRF